MFIVGIGTAVPEKSYTPGECWEALLKSSHFNNLAPRSQAILRKVLRGNNGIDRRHLALDDLSQAFDLSADTLHARFTRHAPELAAQAARRALAHSGAAPEEIDALLVSTCTGYLCPGLTSYVSERLGLRADTLCLDLVGQGCGAAIPNLRAAEGLLATQGCRRALSICVEVCSAAFYLDDDPGVLISACLFGDGAGAAVLSAEPGHHRPIEWLQSTTLLNVEKRDHLRFELRNGLLRNLLAPDVPELAASHARQVFNQLTTAAGISQAHVAGWLFHPGGRDVLLALQSAFALSESDLRWSTAVLLDNGNVSSASLFFVLAEALKDGAQPGQWWMSSFGAGFSCHGALLRAG